jgi:hypothetical protein
VESSSANRAAIGAVSEGPPIWASNGKAARRTRGLLSASRFERRLQEAPAVGFHFRPRERPEHPPDQVWLLVAVAEDSGVERKRRRAKPAVCGQLSDVDGLDRGEQLAHRPFVRNIQRAVLDDVTHQQDDRNAAEHGQIGTESRPDDVRKFRAC